MALTVDATAGGANSNSYITRAEGDTYHEAHLYASTWTGATSGDKEIAVVWATRILDEQIDWNGSRKYTTQALRWPRSGVYDSDGYYLTETEIPQFLKNAVAELARLLLASDRSADPKTFGFKELKAGSLELKVDKLDRPWIIPQSVWAMVRPYGTKTARPTRYLVRC